MFGCPVIPSDSKCILVECVCVLMTMHCEDGEDKFCAREKMVSLEVEEQPVLNQQGATEPRVREREKVMAFRWLEKDRHFSSNFVYRLSLSRQCLKSVTIWGYNNNAPLQRDTVLYLYSNYSVYLLPNGMSSIRLVFV